MDTTEMTTTTPPSPAPFDPETEPETPEEDMGEQEDDRPIEQINILPILLNRVAEWIEKEAKSVVTETTTDEESRTDFMGRRANQLKLFTGLVPTLGYPANGAKAPHLSIMTKAVLHTWARIYDQVVPAKGDIVHTAAMGPDDEDRARRVERHMNWQLRQRMPDWGSSQQVSILAWLLSGSMFRHYRWDPIERSHRVDYVPIDDIVLPYTELDIHPLMKSVPRITRILRMARWELEAYEEQGFFSNLEAIYPPEDGASTTADDVPPKPQDKQSAVQDAVEDVQGVTKPDRPDKTLYKREILAQNKYLKFPDDVAIDGLAGMTKPVTITVDRQTCKPLAVVIREEPDPIDQARFEKQKQAHEIAVKNVAQQASLLPREATPPKPPKAPRAAAMQTIYNIVHFRLFPNPDGIYGLGIGYLLEGSNELANELAADYMLSAKFHNMFTGFMARGTREKRGDVQIAHGKFIDTELEPEVMDKAIKVLEKPAPSEGLMRVVDRLEQNSEIAASADILSGEKGASNETAKGMMVRNSNAMALISVMTRLYLDPLKYEMRMIAHGNSIFLEDEEQFPYSQQTPGVPGRQQITNEKIGRGDYVNDIHIEFTADARMSSKPERISDAKDFLQMILNSPQANNPMMVDFGFRKLWRAAEDPDYEAAMGPPPQPPQPPPPPTPQSQEVENNGFFNEQDHPVLDDDNHMEHLHKITELEKSPLFEHLSSTGKQMLDRHKRAHFGKFYLQLSELQQLTGANLHGMAAAGRAGGMGAGPPGAPAPGALGPEAGGGAAPPPNAGAGGLPGGGPPV